MIRISTLLTILRKYVGADRRNALDYCAYIFSLFMKQSVTIRLQVKSKKVLLKNFLMVQEAYQMMLQE